MHELVWLVLLIAVRAVSLIILTWIVQLVRQLFQAQIVSILLAIKTAR
jgi:hypothetical protein